MCGVCVCVCVFVLICVPAVPLRYPASAKQFIHSGLKGEWDRKKAGLRMKLEQPVTWERLLSQQGNKAATWEQLIGLSQTHAHAHK